MNRQIYDKSIDYVREGINQKLNYGVPYYAKSNTVRNMVTDMDNFPYVRFYRGVYNSDKPGIFDREAGWRQHEQQCYTPSLGFKEPPYPNFCFQAPCSTIYPCYFNYDKARRPFLDVELNRTCVMKSP